MKTFEIIDYFECDRMGVPEWQPDDVRTCDQGKGAEVLELASASGLHSAASIEACQRHTRESAIGVNDNATDTKRLPA